MRKMWILSLLLPLVWTAAAWGASGGDGHFRRGMALYERGMWGAAREEFTRARQAMSGPLDPMRMQCDYLIAMCASQGDDPGAKELLDEFLTRNPHTIYHNDVLFAMSNELYKAGDWGEALLGYMSVDPADLGPQKQAEYYFKQGHCSFLSGEYPQAMRSLRRVGQGNEFSSSATYYMSYMEYIGGNYATARQGFQSLASDPLYGRIVPFYILQTEFLQNNYDYVVRHGDELIRDATRERAREIARIMAESWYHLKDHAKALSSMGLYRSLGGVMEREENYIEGYCLYMTGNYADASAALGQVVGPEDALSQNAAYHLADCYLRADDKRRAMQSFSIASVGRFDETVREDALFNYGKLQYELGGGVFNEAINVLNRYIKEYPSSPRLDEAREYLLSAYYNSRNYEAAYDAIMLIPNPDNNIKAALQKITYFRAMECYGQGDLVEASRLLEMSARNRFNAKYNALTSFWRGEIALRKGDDKAAIPLYREYISLSPRTEPEHALAYYALGYCHFNLKEWAAAADYFEKYLAFKPDNDYAADTYNRLGDIKYSGHSFWAAMEEYDKAIKPATPQRYYAQWRRAVLLGMVDRVPRKIESLREIISAGKGGYVDEAMYELGRTYMGQERFADAADALQRYIDSYPQGAYRIDALSDLGLVSQNMGRTEAALKYYKQVVTESPNSTQAKDALTGIRSLYVEKNDVDGYLAYASGTGMETDVSAQQRDSLSFASAERQYILGAAADAGIIAMKEYLSKFPKGAYRANALYNLGAALMATRGDRAGAKAAYAELSRMYLNEFTVRGLEHLSQMQEQDGELAAACESYENLARAATAPATENRALEGWMRTAGKVSPAAYAGAVAAALASPTADATVTRQARFGSANLALAAGQKDKAMKLYEELAVESQSAEGAESAFRVIEAQAAAGMTAEAKKRVFALSDQNSPHTYWVARAFLVLGEIYVKEGDTFQARATYQSIVDGYPVPDDGIVAQARERISALK